jgi:hypothetical protein
MWPLHPAMRRVSPLAGKGAPLAPYGRAAKRCVEFRQSCVWGIAVGFNKKSEGAAGRDGFLGVLLECETMVSLMAVFLKLQFHTSRCLKNCFPRGGGDAGLMAKMDTCRVIAGCETRRAGARRGRWVLVFCGSG